MTIESWTSENKLAHKETTENKIKYLENYALDVLQWRQDAMEQNDLEWTNRRSGLFDGLCFALCLFKGEPSIEIEIELQTRFYEQQKAKVKK